MKILFLAWDVNIKNKTGDAVHIRELALSLAELGNEVSLIALHTDTDLDEIKTLQKHDNISLFFNKRKRYFRNLSTIMFCKEVAKSQGSEVIYERRFTPKVGFTLNRMLKIPYAVEINGIMDRERQMRNISSGRGIIPLGVTRKIWRHFFKSAGKVVVVSHGLKKALSEEYGLDKHKITVIYNGANTDLFKPMDRKKCIEELGLNQECRYVGFIGNLAPWQGVEQLIEIAPVILQRIPKTRFVIVGDGDMRPELESLAEKLGIRDKIIFTGFVPYETVPKYINSFEVCTAPFNGIERNVKYSFSALKLYEYMACGKTVVTTDVCGIKDEIGDLGLGIVVPADDTQSFTSSVLKLMKNPEFRNTMGEKARTWVCKEHSWKKVAERVALVCEDLIAPRN